MDLMADAMTPVTPDETAIGAVRDVNVLIATPHVGDVSPLWIDALIRLEKPLRADGREGWARACAIRQEVAVARNLLVRTFLATPDATHLLFWDDDVLPPTDGLMRLLERDAPIVSGLYVSRHPPTRPIAYRRLPTRTKREHQYVPMTLPPSHAGGVFAADGVGGGFLLIARAVFERVREPWFQFIYGPRPGLNVSEDLYFCEQAIAAGYRILVDTSVSCGHIGQIIYDEGDLPYEQTRPVNLTEVAG